MYTVLANTHVYVVENRMSTELIESVAMDRRFHITLKVCIGRHYWAMSCIYHMFAVLQLVLHESTMWILVWTRSVKLNAVMGSEKGLLAFSC